MKRVISSLFPVFLFCSSYAQIKDTSNLVVTNGRLTKDGFLCTVSDDVPEFCRQKEIDSLLKIRCSINIIAVHMTYAYDMTYHYSCLTLEDQTWYYSADNHPRISLLIEDQRTAVASINRLSTNRYISYYKLPERQSSAHDFYCYMLNINGKMVDGIFSNVDLKECRGIDNGDERLKLFKDFNGLICQFNMAK